MSALLLLLIGCQTEVSATPPPSRVAAVTAAPVTPADVEAFCDVQHDAASAPLFTWPDLEGEVPAQRGARWIVAWATWCGPCISETPMIVGWQDKLRSHGIVSDVVFFSVDAEKAALDRFYTKEKDFPRGPRIRDAEQLAPWLESLGLDAGAAIPLHVMLDAEGKTRCVRAGALSESDYAVVRALLN